VKRRRWFEVHSWLAVMAGLLLFVICWSGTVAVLAHEIDWLLEPHQRVEPRTGPVQWGRMQAAVEAGFPDAESMTLHAPMYPWAAAHAVIDTPAQKMLRVYLDPHSGAVLGHTSYFNVQRFFRSLHMSLFDFGSGRMWGYWFVGVFGVVLLVMTLTPLVFYRRWWRGFLTLKTNRGSRVFWSDAHKLGGVWSLPFALLIALTGVWYLVEFFDVSLGYPERAAVENAKAATPLPLDALVAAAAAEWPELKIRAVTPATGNYWGEVVHAQGKADAWLVRDRANYVMLDPGTGAVLRRQDATRLAWPARWVDTADPLHFGDFGGLWSKLAWFVFGLLLSALPLTGAYLHVQRLHASARARWVGTGASVLLSAAVLAVAGWGAWRELLHYGPVVAGVQQTPEVPHATAAFLVGWTLLTLAILCTWAWCVLRAPGRSLHR
jgi:uncharacterized iron-regulated membrane protein